VLGKFELVSRSCEKWRVKKKTLQRSNNKPPPSLSSCNYRSCQSPLTERSFTFSLIADSSRRNDVSTRCDSNRGSAMAVMVAPSAMMMERIDQK
jgi:hypothetical protein